MEHANKQVIALDTNMLLAVEKFKMDIFSEIRGIFGSGAEIVVPLEVKKELEAIGEKNNAAVKVAESILEKSRLQIVKTSAKNADDALLELAKKNIVIATNDRELRKKINGFGGKLVYLRKKKFLETNFME